MKFRIPGWRAPILAGVDISAGAVHAVLLQRRAGSLELASYAEVPVPLSAIVHGAVLAPERVVEALRMVRHRLRIQKANASISHLTEEASIGYRGLFEKAGIAPGALEAAPYAVFRAVSAPEDKEAAVLIADFGLHETRLIVAENARTWFASTIDSGGESLSLAKAEVAKKLSEWNGPTNAGRLKPISRMIVCGSVANIPGFPEDLEREFDLPVSLGNVWVNAFSLDSYIPAMQFSESLKYAGAIGAALQGA